MAKFNPDLPDNEKSFMGYSQGAKPMPEQQGPPSLKAAEDPSAEASYYKAKAAAARNSVGNGLTEGLGRLFGEAAKVVDFSVRTGIDDQLEKQVNQVRDEFGVGAAAVTAGAVGDLPPGPAPQGLVSAGQQLDGLSQAYQSGRLQESHYWARLESIVRQMKTRYPGYTEDIDRKVAGLTGGTPANQIRRALQQEAEDALHAQGDEQKRLIALTTDLAKSGELNLIAPDYNQRAAKGTPYTLEELIAKTAEYKKNSAVRTEAVANLEWKKKQGDDTNEEVKRLAGQDLISIYNDTFNGSLKVNGKTFQEFQTEIDQGIANMGAGGVTGEKAQEFAANMMRWRELVINTARNRWNRDFGGGPDGNGLYLKPEDRAALETQITSQFQQMEKDIISGDTALMKADASSIELQTNALTKNMLEDKDMLLISTMRKNFGPELAQVVASRSGVLSSVVESTKRLVAERAITGTAKDMATEADKLKTVNAPPQAYVDLTQTFANIITDPKSTPQGKANAIRFVFSQESQKLFSRFENSSTAKETRWRMYNVLTDPKVMKAMEASANQDPHGYDMYRKWVTDQTQAHILRDAAEIQKGVVFRDSTTFTYDPKSHHVVLHNNPGSGQLNSVERYYESTQIPLIQAAVDRVNKTFDAIAPLFPDNPAEQIDRLMSLSGIDIHQPKADQAGKFLQQIRQAIVDMLPAEKNSPLADTTPNSGAEAAAWRKTKAAGDAALTP